MKVSTRDVVIVALAAALSTALSFLRLFQLPQGGSISLELLPVFYIAFLRGPRHGIAAGAISGTIQLILRPFIVHPIQVLLDYPLPMAAAGVAGWFRTVDSERPLRSLLATGSGLALILIAGTTWTQLDRLHRSSSTVLQQKDAWSVVVDVTPDTILGDVEARLTTIQEHPSGRVDTVSVVTAHGEKARIWLNQATGRVQADSVRILGNALVQLLVLGGIVIAARFVNVGAVSLGVLAGSALVFLSHFTAGVVFFAEYAPAGQSVWVYSALYNASYVVPQVILSLLILPPLLKRSHTV